LCTYSAKRKFAHELLNASSKIKSCTISCYRKRERERERERDRKRKKEEDQVFTFKVNPLTGA